MTSHQGESLLLPPTNLALTLGMVPHSCSLINLHCSVDMTLLSIYCTRNQPPLAGHWKGAFPGTAGRDCCRHTNTRNAAQPQLPANTDPAASPSWATTRPPNVASSTLRNSSATPMAVDAGSKQYMWALNVTVAWSPTTKSMCPRACDWVGASFGGPKFEGVKLTGENFAGKGFCRS